jgi:hypothetical protein
MCDSCNLFSRSNIKKGLRFLKGQEQTHAISIRLLGNYFHCNKIWMVFQYSNICSFCTYCLLYWRGRGFAAQIRLISHRQVKHKDETLWQTADRQMQPSIVAGFFNLHLASLGGFWPHSTDTTTATYWPEVLKIVTPWLTKIPKHLSWRLQNPQTHVPGHMELLV